MANRRTVAGAFIAGSVGGFACRAILSRSSVGSGVVASVPEPTDTSPGLRLVEDVILPGDRLPIDPALPFRCVECRTEQTGLRWKCCPDHTSELGPDFVCSRCSVALHPALGVL